MLHFLLIPIVAAASSLLTLFSGFGLGTILLPAFALFFPIDLAVAMTAVVHLLNNLFKLSLLGKHANLRIVALFGLPAIVASLAGALILVWLAGIPPLFTYGPGGRYQITFVKLIVATLMILFALLEVLPKWKDRSFDEKYLPAGGIISGFFGGLSGHQGALRSAFLIRASLSKESFLATNIVVACLVDLVRIGVYAQHFSIEGLRSNHTLIIVTTLAAFLGAFAGTRLIKKITLQWIRTLVSILLCALAVAIASGIA